MARRLTDVCDLVPVDRAEFFSEVAPCLTLVAGVGMSQPDQDAWLEAAYQALAGIPIALLRRGAQAAMQKADHPSKIVPAIIAEIGESWQWRKEHRPSVSVAAPHPLPRERRIERPLTLAEITQANADFEKIGLRTRYRDDGTKFEIETPEQRREFLGPRRYPTRADYLAMGVDPAVLDDISAQPEIIQ